MNKNKFIKDYLRPKITLNAFKELNFLNNSNIKVIKKIVSTTTIGNYYTPWYYYGEEEIKDFNIVLLNKKARSIKISEVNKRSADSDRNKNIKEYELLVPNQIYFNPFPIATNIDNKKTLILDGNKTLTALFNNRKPIEITLIEILGETNEIEQMVQDFEIINRSQL